MYYKFKPILKYIMECLGQYINLSILFYNIIMWCSTIMCTTSNETNHIEMKKAYTNDCRAEWVWYVLFYSFFFLLFFPPDESVIFCCVPWQSLKSANHLQPLNATTWVCIYIYIKQFLGMDELREVNGKQMRWLTFWFCRAESYSTIDGS